MSEKFSYTIFMKTFVCCIKYHKACLSSSVGAALITSLAADSSVANVHVVAVIVVVTVAATPPSAWVTPGVLSITSWFTPLVTPLPCSLWASGACSTLWRVGQCGEETNEVLYRGIVGQIGVVR